MARAIELTDEIKEYLEEYYPDKDFPNLYEASKALLEISKDTEDDGEEDDEAWEEENEDVFEGSYNNEPAQPMSELDKLIQQDERHLQLERARQIQEIKLQKLEEEYEDVSDGSDHEGSAQSLTPLEIKRLIKEKMLQL